MLVVNVRAGRLDGSSNRLDDSSEIVRGYSTGTENVPVGKVLGGEITDGKLGKYHFGARGDDGFELLVDDRPFGIDDRLVFLFDPRNRKIVRARHRQTKKKKRKEKTTHRHLVHSNLCVVLLRLELQLDVQAKHLGVLEALGLLLKTSVRKRLFESNTLDQQRILHNAQPLQTG